MDDPLEDPTKKDRGTSPKSSTQWTKPRMAKIRSVGYIKKDRLDFSDIVRVKQLGVEDFELLRQNYLELQNQNSLLRRSLSESGQKHSELRRKHINLERTHTELEQNYIELQSEVKEKQKFTLEKSAARNNFLVKWLGRLLMNKEIENPTRSVKKSIWSKNLNYILPVISINFVLDFV